MKELAINCQQLGKVFQLSKRPPGVLNALKSLVHRPTVENIAVEDFHLQVERGQMVGLLGPNGAGKTTLMKMFAGIIVPSFGQLQIFGHTPHQRSKEFRKNLALVMGQKAQLWWDIPAMDSLQLLQKYYEIPRAAYRDRLQELSETLQVKNLLHVPLRKLSLGERMKMELMASLLHRPTILFLDEPTIGLDVLAQQKMREFIRQYHQRENITVILTSHYMADVEALCSRIVLVDKGRKRFDGSLQDFGRQLGEDKLVEFSFERAVDPGHPLWKQVVVQFKDEMKRAQILVPQKDLREVSAAIFKNFEVVDFHSEKTPIERVMGQLITRSIAETEESQR